ncbi:MAG: FlgD immunoglobulin-like domain containing protein, partial [Gemmatimonadota bacterium]
SALNNNGFFGSDLRGDPTALLPPNGRRLIAGDVSGDNEINEDDVNLIIAAWGSNGGKPHFQQADINNDLVVGAADLTVTTSNFGNSQGFGAPPVYRPAVVRRRPEAAEAAISRPVLADTAARGDNGGASVELSPLFDPRHPPRKGDVVAVEVQARQLDELAGYEVSLRYDERRLRVVAERTEAGDVFAANPYGAVFEARGEPGSLHIISSRIGKEWAASGDGSLARVWIEVMDEDFATALEPEAGVLLTPGYQPAAVSWGRSLAELLLPREPGLDPNYPNPFNPATTIPFALPTAQDVRLEVYNVLGQRVRTLLSGPLEPGFHTLVWNGRDDAGRDVAAGLYLSLLETAELRLTRKMLLVK